MQNCFPQLTTKIDAPIQEVEKIKTNFQDYILQKKNLENATLNAYCLMKSMDIEKTLLTNKLLMKSFEKKLTQYLNPVEWNPESIQLEYV